MRRLRTRDTKLLCVAVLGVLLAGCGSAASQPKGPGEGNSGRTVEAPSATKDRTIRIGRGTVSAEAGASIHKLAPTPAARPEGRR